MDKLVVPGTGVELVDGSIVILARFPGTKWIVHNGWYNYQGVQSVGWYFCAIPSQTVLPVSDEDLKLLTVVSNSDTCPCPPYPPPSPPPFPPVPFPPERPEQFTKQRAWELSRAWISVQTITERDSLPDSSKTDGRIVRVDETPDGTPGYYRWDAAKNDWVNETFGINTDDLVNRQELQIVNSDLQSFKDDVNKSNGYIVQRLDSIEGNIETINQDIDNMEQQISDIEANGVQWIELK